MKSGLIPAIVLAAGATAGADLRSSADYGVTTETLDSGGTRAESADYINSGSVGGGAGTSTAPVPVTTARHGYLGQIYEFASLVVSAAPASVDEGGSRQLAATAVLDDLTLLPLAATEVAWSVLFGPLTGVDDGGMVTAGVVAADTGAGVRGIYREGSAQQNLTVRDTVADNYNEYAGDGVADDWQVIHFGEPPNVEAGPDENPDADPHGNLFESLTGSDPNDGTDFLRFFVRERGGITATLRLSRVVPGTIYTVRRSTDLGETVRFAAVPGLSFTVSSERADFDLVDGGTPDPDQFYLLEVTRE